MCHKPQVYTLTVSRIKTVENNERKENSINNNNKVAHNWVALKNPLGKSYLVTASKDLP